MTRQIGCYDCAQLTSGDCGQHGPVHSSSASITPGEIAPDSRSLRTRILRWAEQQPTFGAEETHLAAAREALRYVLELDEDDTKDRPPTNVIIAQALADLGGS